MREDDWSSFSEYKIPGLVWKKNLIGGGYSTKVRGATWRIRMNNFPDEPMYTLIVGNVDILNFNDWPNEWIKR